jgi:hypothetical protein
MRAESDQRFFNVGDIIKIKDWEEISQGGRYVISSEVAGLDNYGRPCTLYFNNDMLSLCGSVVPVQEIIQNQKNYFLGIRDPDSEFPWMIAANWVEPVAEWSQKNTVKKYKFNEELV